MADVDFDEFEGGYAQPVVGRASRFVSLAGAVCSLALIAGLGIWGYKLAVRDVSGIPVVRALEGPLRIAPETPGGDVAMHQGLSVNAVASAGSALPLPEKLVLAPPEVDLAADDQAGTAVLAAVPEAADGSAVAAGTLAPDETATTNLAASDLSSTQPVEVAPLAAAPGDTDLAVDAPLPATQEDAVAAALAAALADGGDAEAAASIAPAPAAKSVRPKARPAVKPVAAMAVTEADAVAQPAEAAPEAAPVAASEVDPTTIAAGTRLVQLGAFDDEAAARAAWGDLQVKFPELLAAKAMVVQPAQSGGRAFYRLRAQGFTAEDDARQFCAALLAENASCIPVTQK